MSEIIDITDVPSAETPEESVKQQEIAVTVQIEPEKMVQDIVPEESNVVTKEMTEEESVKQQETTVPVQIEAENNVQDTVVTKEMPEDSTNTNELKELKAITEDSGNITAEEQSTEGMTINPAPDPATVPPISVAPPSTKAQTPQQLPNTSLGLLASQYNSNSEDENDSDSDSNPVEIIEPRDGQNYRSDVIAINSESDSSDSDVEIISKARELQKIIDIDDDDDEEPNNKHRGPIRVKGELLIDDLPPIQDLHITVPEYECAELGKIHSIVDQLVLVDSIPGTVPLDLDTVLFLNKGSKVLGEVFDVLGQVSSPLYCVRFNSNKQIKERDIKIGETVYIAPRSKHTQFVILPDMMKIRGSDASWENDIEPSEKNLDYSDDEEERNARRSHRNRDRSEDVDPSKKPRQTQQQQQQHVPRESRPRPGHQVGYQHANYNPRFHYQNQGVPPYQQQQPFSYNTAAPTWHGQYNQPNPYYPPPPYSGVGYVPQPGNMQHIIYPPPPPPQ